MSDSLRELYERRLAAAESYLLNAMGHYTNQCEVDKAKIEIIDSQIALARLEERMAAKKPPSK